MKITNKQTNIKNSPAEGSKKKIENQRPLSTLFPELYFPYTSFLLVAVSTTYSYFHFVPWYALA